MGNKIKKSYRHIDSNIYIKKTIRKAGKTGRDYTFLPSPVLSEVEVCLPYKNYFKLF